MSRRKNKGGRPPVISEQTLQQLELAFKIACSDEEACFYAEISPSTLYNYQVKNPLFLEKKRLWKKRPILKARQVIMQALDNNDVSIARWYLERREPDEYGERLNVKELEQDGGSHPEDDEIRKELKERLKANIRRRAAEKFKNKANEKE